MASKPVLPNRWLVATIVSCARIGVGFQFISVAALIPELKSELGFDYTEIGILLGTFMVTGIFMSLPSGMISARLGDRCMLQTGLAALVSGGLVMGAGDSFAGGVVGYLAAEGRADMDTLRRAMVRGTVIASFAIEDFSF